MDGTTETAYDTVYYPNRECIVLGEREATLDEDTRRLANIRRAIATATSDWAKNYWTTAEARLLREFRWKGLSASTHGTCTY